MLFGYIEKNEYKLAGFWKRVAIAIKLKGESFVLKLIIDSVGHRAISAKPNSTFFAGECS